MQSKVLEVIIIDQKHPIFKSKDQVKKIKGEIEIANKSQLSFLSLS